MRREIIAPISDYVLFDIETTGLSPRNDGITELSALKIENHRVVDSFTTLVNCGIWISPEITDLTGITNRMVKDAPSPEDAVRSFLIFAGSSPLAGHNIKTFDLKFIDAAAARAGVTVENSFLDSLVLARRLLPQLASRSLGSLADYYSVSYAGAHRAEADCRINFQVLEKLFEEMQQKDAGMPVCPLCGSPLVKRSGRYGAFWGCMGYPACDYTKKI